VNGDGAGPGQFAAVDAALAPDQFRGAGRAAAGGTGQRGQAEPNQPGRPGSQTQDGVHGAVLTAGRVDVRLSYGTAPPGVKEGAGDAELFGRTGILLGPGGRRASIKSQFDRGPRLTPEEPVHAVHQTTVGGRPGGPLSHPA